MTMTMTLMTDASGEPLFPVVSKLEFRNIIKEIKYQIAVQQREFPRVLPTLVHGSFEERERHMKEVRALNQWIMYAAALQRLRLVGVNDPPELAEALINTFVPRCRRGAVLDELRKHFDEDRGRYGVKPARALYWLRSIPSIFPPLYWAGVLVAAFPWMGRVIELVGAASIARFILDLWKHQWDHWLK